MRIALTIAIAGAACAHAPPRTEPPAPPSEASIVERSHALLDAYYRGDLETLRAQLAPGFVRFESEKVSPRDKELERLANKKPQGAPFTRAWKDEHAYVRGNDAVFIGMAIEHETRNTSHGNREYYGWYTMSWVRDGGTWKVTHWTWQPHHTELEAERESWNETYRQSRGFNHEPNRLLVDTVRGRAPGRALDVMMGQGRNAVYLATQGWNVTGVDISNEGLALARAAAAAHHVALDAVEADIETYEFGSAAWDLVTMIYAGDSAPMIEKIKPSLRPGGLFIVEYFLAGPTSCCGGFERGLPAKLFAGGDWEIIRDDIVEDAPDWARDTANLVRFVARKRCAATERAGQAGQMIEPI
jgi:SAM-dependent methyltransferase